MNKKTLIILALFVAAIGVILTGLFGEDAFTEGMTKATYCEFNEDLESITKGKDGRKYMQVPDVELGNSYTIYLNEYIKYDEEASQDVAEIAVRMTTNHPEYVTLRSTFILTFNAVSSVLPNDLTVTIAISTNDGSNLTDTLYIVDDPSNISQGMDPDF